MLQEREHREKNKQPETFAENQKSILDLLKSIDNNLLYLKRAIICEHFKTEIRDKWFDQNCTCQFCGAGIFKGEK